jgi:hypothetical protein
MFSLNDRCFFAGSGIALCRAPARLQVLTYPKV